MINISEADLNAENYDTTNVKLAEGQEDGTYNIYYADDDKGKASVLEIEKTAKGRELGINTRSKKKESLITVDVPVIGAGEYMNDSRSFNRVRAKCGLKAGFKIRRDGVRVDHTMEQIEFIYEAMLERYELLVEQQEETQEAINEATTIEELELIDINIEV